MLEECISHAFEAGRRGKPDEFETGLAQLIGARLIELGNKPRFDLHIDGGYEPRYDKYTIFIHGEISKSMLTPSIKSEMERITLDHYNAINQDSLVNRDFIFSYALKPQADVLAKNEEEGDSGTPLAVALRNAPRYLPWERYLAVGIRDIIDDIYANSGIVPDYISEICGVKKLEGLRPDGKINVKTRYLGGTLKSIDKITIAAEHEEHLTLRELRRNLKKIVKAYIENSKKDYKGTELEFGQPEIIINNKGAWNLGGWKVDDGSREAKPYRDCFSTHGCNEDSFSGEDPTKVSGTGTFMARYIAVQIVYNKLADYARVMLDYDIGGKRRKGYKIGVDIYTAGTAKISQEELESWAKDIVLMKFNDTIKEFDLWNPDLYRKIAKASDFFHDRTLPWNQENFIYKI